MNSAEEKLNLIIYYRRIIMNNYKMIAMIPARLGSKRVPKKNLRYLWDKPLIQYSIELSVKSSFFDSVWVNTESVELGKVAEKLGASFHKRPKELAIDTATNRDFTYEFLKLHECDYVVMVNTTSPLITEETLAGFIEYINANDFDTVVSIVSEKAESFYRDQPINFTLEDKINSQLLEPVDRIVWCITAWKRETFISLQEQGINPVFAGKMGKYIIPKDEACDIDTEEDWKIAEGILAARNIKSNEVRYLLVNEES
jgi:CMP-N-acetylneuraminic acid synthetase